MLTIRKEQMASFERQALARFEDETVARLSEDFPDRVAALGEPGVRALVQDGLARAAGYGIEGKAEVGLFIDLLVGIDPEFERLEEWEWARALLESEELDGLAKIELVYAGLEEAHA